MWFKQLQLFQLDRSINAVSVNTLAEKLESLSFSPCLPSMPESIGWVPPIDDEDEPLTRSINGFAMLCLQIEEKILPASVIQTALHETTKQIELSENRKIRAREKLSLKDDIVLSLLPRAFSKLTRIYAYIDTQHHWLLLGTAHTKRTEQFISFFKKSMNSDIQAIDVKNLSSKMTSWLLNKNYPHSFVVENACVLQDAKQENRIIRCKHQNLFAEPILSLVKDGCDVNQLALSWNDHVSFVLSDDFKLSSIQFEDELIAQAKETSPETKLQAFAADFLLMSATFSTLLTDLLAVMHESPQQNIHKLASA